MRPGLSQALWKRAQRYSPRDPLLRWSLVVFLPITIAVSLGIHFMNEWFGDPGPVQLVLRLVVGWSLFAFGVILVWRKAGRQQSKLDSKGDRDEKG